MEGLCTEEGLCRPSTTPVKIPKQLGRSKVRVKYHPNLNISGVEFLSPLPRFSLCQVAPDLARDKLHSGDSIVNIVFVSRNFQYISDSG